METRLPFFDTGTTICLLNCSRSTPYYTGIHECFRKCPPNYYKDPNSLECILAGNTRTAIQKVSTQGVSYAYYARQATSYSEMDLNMAGSGSVSAFLEAQDSVMYLRLRATTQAWISYAPVLFLQAKAMLQCELQFTAPQPRSSAVLAVRLLNPLSVSGCYLFSGFTNSGNYPSAIFTNGYQISVSGSVIDIDGKNIDYWFRAKGTGNIVYDGI